MRTMIELLEELAHLGQLMDRVIPGLITRKHGPGGWQTVVDELSNDELKPFDMPIRGSLVSDLRLNLGILQAMCDGRTFLELLVDEIGDYPPESPAWDWDGWLHNETISLPTIAEVVITFGSNDVARVAIEYYAKRLLDDNQQLQSTYEPHTIGAAVSRLISLAGVLNNPTIWLYSLKDRDQGSCRAFLGLAQDELNKLPGTARQRDFLEAYNSYLLEPHCSE